MDEFLMKSMRTGLSSRGGTGLSFWDRQGDRAGAGLGQDPVGALATLVHHFPHPFLP
jgi:hypothetical protein